MDDVSLTFDPSSFINGLKKITEAMNGFESKTKEKGEQVNKTSEGMSSFMVAKGMIMGQALMGAFNKAFNFIKNGLPEVGRSMGIASDIIQRNLLWPLRKELAPILQKMLDWVRDHRAMFVRWGGVLVNIFRAVVQVMKGFISMWNALISPIADKMKSLFKNTGGGISDIFNIVLFKITAVIMFLQMAFMPLIKKMGDTIAWAIELVASFFRGFSNGIAGIAGPFSDLITQFNELLSVLTMSNSQSNMLFDVFNAIGDFVGTTLYTVISGLAQIIDGWANSIKNVTDGISWAKAKLTGTAGEAEAIANQMEKRNKEFDERTNQRIDGLKKKWGTFVDRTQATFSPNSNTSSKQINATSKVNIEKMEIKVGPGEDPKKAGESFIEGMNKKNSQNFKNILLNEAGSLGY